jgi:hypothetical protein
LALARPVLEKERTRGDAMTRRLDAVALVLAAALAGPACSRSGGLAPPHPAGATSFRSPPPGSPASAAVDVGTAAGTPGSTETASPLTPGASAPSRAVEEADIYARSGSTLLVLNAYRGLQLADLADLSHPRLLSRVPVVGTPVDLYLRGSTAFVVVTDYFSYVLAADGSGARPQRGSRVLAVDVADPAAPRVLASLAVDGQVLQTRIVGDVLYVVSRHYWWYDWIGPVSIGAGAAAIAGPICLACPPTPGKDVVFVQSFDVSSPSAPRPVDRLELPASGWDTHANVTPERITLSLSGWDVDSVGSYGPATHFQAVDIADPGGALAGGAAFATPGLVRDRWGMDFDGAAGIFRAVVASGWSGGAALQTWSSPAPGAAEPLARLSLDVPESLTAARFDGARVYVVTARAVDPLWAIDASDPAHPVLEGQLAMPGQLDFIEPRGDRLVALGHTAEAGQPFQLAVSLLDVADPASPKLLSRATFGPGWGSVSVSPDDMRKAFLVFDPPPAGAGLVLVPLQGWDPATWSWAGGTQLLDLSRDAVAARGFLAHPGSVTRAFPVDAAGTRLVALSDQSLQTIDAADRGAPVELARLDLARSVTALSLVRGHAVELAGDWTRGDAELVVTDALDPDAAEPLARVPVAAPSARMFQDGTVTWLLAHDWSTGAGWLQAVDFSDPVHPVLRGRLDLSAADSAALWPRWWGFGDEAVLVGHALAVHRQAYYCLGPLPCPLQPADQVRVYDLSDPDAPKLASTVDLPGSSWSWGLVAEGSFLWLTHYEWDPAGADGAYFLDRIDLADPAAPALLAGVNVPGVFFAASDDGSRIYTLETWWKDGTATTWMHGLLLGADGKAHLRGSAALTGYPAGAAAGPAFAWAATADWSAGTGATTRLAAVDLSSMAIASDQAVEGDWAWLARAAGGKLFLQAGWQDQGILIYGLADPGRPAFEQFVRTQGWVWDIVVGGEYAYLPSGPYGVPMVKLLPPFFCGGIAGIPCPGGLTCVDDPSDTCDPAHGGADCGGLCVP